MTGSASDPPDWPTHTKPRREALANHLRDAADPPHIALVLDLWHTDFDAARLRP